MKKKPKIKNEKLVAILAYLVVGVIWYFVDEKIQKSSLAKFHVKQAINLWIISVCLNVGLSIIIFVGWILIPIVNFVILIWWIIGLIHAMNGHETEIPLIGKFAKRYLKF